MTFTHSGQYTYASPRASKAIAKYHPRHISITMLPCCFVKLTAFLFVQLVKFNRLARRRERERITAAKLNKTNTLWKCLLMLTRQRNDYEHQRIDEYFLL